MTDDYPTRAEIQTTRKTLVQLRSRLGGPSIVHPLAYTALSSALVVLEQLDQVPGLHAPSPDPEPEPEPEPKPTAAEVLEAAWGRTEFSVDEAVMHSAFRIAEAHPDLFVGVDWAQPVRALRIAARRAYFGGNYIAQAALLSTTHVADTRPHLFGGAA